jgi:hypothetical protein
MSKSMTLYAAPVSSSFIIRVTVKSIALKVACMLTVLPAVAQMPGVVTVTSYGADPTGAKDSTQAFVAARLKNSARGGTSRMDIPPLSGIGGKRRVVRRSIGGFEGLVQN